MAVKQVKVNGVPVPGLFQKVNTEGAVSRFVGAETGYAQVIHKADDTVLPDGRNRVVIDPNHSAPNNTPQYIDFVLGFRYFVGLHQLEVLLVENLMSGLMRPMMDKVTIEQARLAWALWATPTYENDLDPDGDRLIHFQERTSDTLRVYNPGNYSAFMFTIPHTSLQAASRQKIIIQNQGNNEALEMLGNGDGILLRSPDGRKGLLRLSNAMIVGVDPK